jgi:nanoRNase/pAp phosphatase (c-di-AMP/oligoRNAs hydrolase)
VRALAVCQDELVIRTLHRVLSGTFDIEFLVESRPLARRLVEDGVSATVADIKRTDTYVRADLTPGTCVIVEDTGRKGLKRVVTAIRDAGGSLLYILHANGLPTRRGQDELRAVMPEITHLDLGELLAPTLTTELGRSLTRARVHQYQRYFADADRVLFLLHNEPDPDALAAGLALRNVLRRTRTTAIIGAVQGVTRPENLRMVNLLDITSRRSAGRSSSTGWRWSTSSHYFGGLPRADLVIDHHRAAGLFGSVQGHPIGLRLDVHDPDGAPAGDRRNISERTATAMLYAIKSDTLFFARQTNRVDLEAFTFLYPLADPALIRKMEGAEITLERLEHVTRALATSRFRNQVFSAFIGQTTREDFVPYTADFLLQLEDVKWTIVSGIVGSQLIISVRNLGYSRNAGEFVKASFGDIGSAGGHRAMAKASPHRAVPWQVRRFIRHRHREPHRGARENFLTGPVPPRPEARQGLGAERLIEIRDKIVPHVRGRPTGNIPRVTPAPPVVRPETVLATSGRQTAQALGAAKAGGALATAEPVEHPRQPPRSCRRRSTPCR